MEIFFPFKIASAYVKYSEINLTKNRQKHYIEKQQKKYCLVKLDLSEKRDIMYSWIGKINTINVKIIS